MKRFSDADLDALYLAADDRELFRASAEFRAAWKAMRARSDARAALPPGSSRARVTTANARWHSACEHVERLRRATRGAA